jgi:hypothetical protein
MHESIPLFWVALIATGLIGVYFMVKASGDPKEIYGLMPVGCGMWLYLFGFMAYQTATGLIDFFPPQALVLGESLALVCLIGMVLGWRYGLSKPEPQRHRPIGCCYDYSRLWRGGMTLLLIGFTAFRSFGSLRNGDFTNTSAYWYMLGGLVYPAACLCVIALCRERRLRTIPNLAMFSVVLFIAVVPYILAARRGPFFTLIMVMLYTPALIGTWRPRRTTLFGVLVITGFVMLLMVLVRPYISDAGRGGWKAALGETSVEDTVTYRGATLADNEYAYHCAAVWTTYQLGLYQYGTGDLSLLLHWVPRGWWPDKPELGRGWMERVEDRIGGVLGWDMVVGGAITGPASSFHQYGMACPLFWYLIGYGFGRVFRRSSAAHDDRWVLIWVMLLASLHWLIAQSFHDAFVPACIYVFVPLIVFRYARLGPVPSHYPMRSAISSSGASGWV